jgi:tetratricopeptide (TPR) repeat protein
MNRSQLNKILAPTRALLPSVLLLAFFAAHARAQTEASAAWQVTQFDITATVSAPVAERTLTSRAALSARNVGQAAGQTFTARINPLASIKSVSVNDAPATFTKLTEARTQLQLVRVALPAQVAPGASVKVAFDYALPLGANNALASIGAEGAQFLPLSFWYPSPNSPTSPRGADVAPVRMAINAPAGDAAIASGQASGSGFDQKLSAQPFFVTGKWDAVEGAGDARGVTALLPRGATADERKRAETLIAFAAAARAYFASTLGGAADAPLRLVAVNRGAGFDMGGTILVEPATFRRAKLDATTALAVAESVARLWIGGTTPVRGAGAGVVSEGLIRHLALAFIEKQSGAEAVAAERLRERAAFGAVARLDAPLSLLTPLEQNYSTLAANKGAMVWRLAERALGREVFLAVVQSLLQNGRSGEITLASFRALLVAAGGARMKAMLDAELDQPTQTDLLVGIPQQRADGWVSALRNTGSFDVTVTVVARTLSGERVTTEATVKASDFGEAIFKTNSRIVSAEVDPEKLYPQTDYSNDEAPRQPAIDASLEEATRALTNQDFARAESLARSLVARQPLMQDARTLLARTLVEENKLDEAEREFRASIDSTLPLPSTLAWANVGLGEIALRKGQAGEASRLFTEAVRAEGGYPPTLAARSARLRAETVQGSSAPAIDEAVRAFATQFDAAIKSGRKAEIDALIAPGELPNFSRGIITNQPELWQTRVLRTESLGGDRVVADVQINSRVAGSDKNGTAVLVFTRAGARLLLTEIPIFEVR